MKKLQDWAAFIFIICVVILATISICGVWKIFSDDVITKSIQTFGLLSVVAVIIIIAGRFVDSREQVATSGTGVVPGEPLFNPIFTTIRHITIAVLIVSISLLALLGVLAIWKVFSGTILEKSLSSITIMAFSSLVIVITCAEREKHRLMQQKMSGWVIFLIVLFAWTFLRYLW